MMTWPPQSPHLNPIENLLVSWKRKPTRETWRIWRDWVLMTALVIPGFFALCSLIPFNHFFPLPRVPWNWWYIPCCSLNMIPLVLETKLMLLDLKPAGRGRVLPGFSQGVLVLLTRGKTGAHRKKKKSVCTNFCFPITLPKRLN